MDILASAEISSASAAVQQHLIPHRLPHHLHPKWWGRQCGIEWVEWLYYNWAV